MKTDYKLQADHNLDAQQQHLASLNYDLRITNLARFIYKKITNYELQVTNALLDKEEIRKKKEENLKLIDIGAGNGLFLKFFKEKGLQVAGIELETENVQHMKKDPQLAGVDVREGDITNMKGQESYDVVIASDVIEHIQDDEKAIENLWTFVRPGGILIITVPAHAHLFGKRDVAWGHFRRYDKKSLELKLTSLKSGSIEFLTFWNTVGYFVYFFYEKMLQKPINEKMRYSNSLSSRIAKTVLDKILRFEETLEGTPLGLTLIVGVRKKK